MKFKNIFNLKNKKSYSLFQSASRNAFAALLSMGAQIIFFTLIIQLSFGSSAFLYAQNKTNQSSNDIRPDFNSQDLNYLANNLSQTFETENSKIQPLLALANAIDAKPLNQAELPNKDFHLLSSQTIEYFRQGEVYKVIDLKDPQLRLPSVAYSNLKIRYDKDKKQLIFEGIRGENDKGENGEIVIRQIINGVDIKAFAYDKDLIVYADSNGALNAINNQFVKTSIFKTTIPVFQKIWSPTTPLQLQDKKVFIEFRTRSSEPIDINKIQSNNRDFAILRSDTGKPIFTAGDVLISYENNQHIEYLGLLNRVQIAEDIYNLSKFAFEVGTLSQNNSKLLEQIEPKLNAIDDKTSNLNNNTNSNSNSNIESTNQVDLKSYISQLSQADIKQLSQISPEILSEIKKSSAFISEQSFTLKDQFTLKENESLFKNIKLSPPTSAEFYHESKASKLLNTSAQFLGKWYTMAVLGIGYLYFPFAYEQHETLQQIKILSWTYHHLYTDVMKDAAYRLVNCRSIIKLLLIIPAAMLASASVGWLLKGSAKVLQNSSSLAAQRIRDLARVWGDMGVWQRIITFSNRYYAVWVYPVLRIMLSHMLRQKGLFTGLEAGITNPFEKVKADSELGRKLGLTKDEYALWNNPIKASISLAKYLEPMGIQIPEKLFKLTDAKSNYIAERKQNIQMAIVTEKQKYRKLAWIFSVLVVSQKTGIDPASIVYATELSNNGIDFILDLKKIFQSNLDAEKFKIISEEFYKSFYDLKVLKGQAVQEFSKNPEEFKNLLNISNDIADKILKSNSQKALTQLKLKFKSIIENSAKSVATYSMNEVEILRNSVPNKDIYSMVQREFILDHIQVSTVPAMVGERADLKHPEELTAKAGSFLDTNPKHLYDAAYNTYAHLLLAGAQDTLTYYQAEKEIESKYDPLEFQQYKIKERTESLVLSTYQFFRYLLPDKSDIGGIIINDLKRRLATIQSKIYIAVFMRGLAFSAPPAIIAKAFGFEFFSSLIWWGWIWFPMQIGTQMGTSRTDEVRSEIQNAQLKISRLLREVSFSKSQSEYINSLKTAYLELLYSYKKNAPAYLEKIFKITNSEFIKHSDQNVNDYMDVQKQWLKLKYRDLSSVEKDPQLNKAQQYFGILIKLAISIKNNQTDQVQLYKNQILRLQSEDLDRAEQIELSKLSAEGLLEFSVLNPPKASIVHPLVPWLATQTAVIVSTYKAIEWSVVILNPDLLNEPFLIHTWFLKWLAFYGVIYLVGTKDNYNKIKNKITDAFQSATESKYLNSILDKLKIFSNKNKTVNIFNTESSRIYSCQKIYR